MTDSKYDWTNPQHWMDQINETTNSLIKLTTKNMKTWNDQAQQFVEITNKNVSTLHEEWKKSSEVVTENVRKNTEMVSQAWKTGMDQLKNVYKPPK